MSGFLRQFVLSLPIGIAFTDLIASVVRVDGASMQPTLNPVGSTSSDYVLVEKFTIKVMQKYRRGDVVILWAPDEPYQQMVKRLVGLENDVVLMPDSGELEKVPAGRCWVEGDNADTSADSRTSYGPVHLGLLQGRVTYVVWPPSRIGRVDSSLPAHRVLVEEDSSWI